MKFAVIERLDDITTVQVLPEGDRQFVQLAKRYLSAGDAVRTIDAIYGYVAVHEVPQSIPARLDVTVPDPVLETVRVRTPWKVAVTVFAASIVTVQVVAVTGAQFDDHPTRTEPEAGVPVRVTVDPTANGAEQVEPHEMPLGLDVTVPLPEFRDDLVTLSVARSENVAVTFFGPFITSEQVVWVPEQSPDHPVNTDPVARVAVSVTAVPAPNDVEHVAPHEMPLGLDEIEPLPAPAFVTVRS